MYSVRCVLSRKLSLGYNTLCVTLLHGVFSRCYWATFRLKSLCLKYVGPSAAAEHTSQAFFFMSLLKKAYATRLTAEFTICSIFKM